MRLSYINNPLKVRSEKRLNAIMVLSILIHRNIYTNLPLAYSLYSTLVKFWLRKSIDYIQDYRNSADTYNIPSMIEFMIRVKLYKY